MILTVTPNPALDLTWVVDRLEIGGSHRADTGAARAGGKGLNVARVAHAQGAPVLALTTAGGRTGDELRTDLEASGVPHRLIPVDAPTRRSAAWVDRTLGDSTIVNERGVNPSPAEWAAVIAAVREEAAAASVLIIAGSLPPGAPADLLPALIAAADGIDVIVDTSGPGLLAAADAGAAVLKPNRVEVVEATGIVDPAEGARELVRRGAGVVLLSLGSDGLCAVTSTGEWRARLPAPLAGNPTGAGDAAVAAAACLLDAGIRDTEVILRRAAAWSAAAVLMPLAGEISPRWRDLERSLIVEKPPAV
ncbi:1-phosphofructokinase family hexose kinase [Microbacterium sp. CIAB417]|uniref:1-phosphofructokinase family hexose kinase n=1 Tax=Microbacterium sp. CIAB417 TaxID=2860287 RepID=UPI001FAD0EF9|nr:hexose kinase [Microbacterium sp. CIAB417]